MPPNPFFDYYERTWIDHQADQSQHPGPCTGLSQGQILDRVATWLAGFNPLIVPESQTALDIRVVIVQRFYG